jgi:hypothetical protein
MIPSAPGPRPNVAAISRPATEMFTRSMKLTVLAANSRRMISYRLYPI